MLNWLEDQVLRWIQRRCKHPGDMVAVDISEGSTAPHEIRYCRRCGAVQVAKNDFTAEIQIPYQWRLPEPNLWRGR